VLLLTDDAKVASALARLKPWGILPLEASAEELLAAVAALHEGLIVVSPSLAGEAIERLVGLGEGEELAQAPADSPAQPLTSASGRCCSFWRRAWPTSRSPPR